MKKTYLQKGFTLIELLVVISIIGLLSSVILASLGSARGKSIDAAVKTTLISARTQADIYYSSNNNSYVGVCNGAGIYNLVLAAAKYSNPSITGVAGNNTAFSYNIVGNGSGAVCHNDTLPGGVGWAAIVSLKAPTTPNSGWCIDSSSNSKEFTVLGSTSVTCGF
jgi:prepilin-type N-terminal cleavage/methylation domain-containing protein